MWKPEGEWELLSGEYHSTVYSPKLKLVFDPLLFSSEDGPVILAFAQGAEWAVKKLTEMPLPPT